MGGKNEICNVVKFRTVLLITISPLFFIPAGLPKRHVTFLPPNERLIHIITPLLALGYLSEL
jgi:hypothetical protein